MTETPAPTRHAVIRGIGREKLETVRRYLPSNYSADCDGGNIWIHGVDSAGWTLDGYVIPRLASGLYRAEEVVRTPRPPRTVFKCPECGLTATTETDPNEWVYGHDCEV